MRELNRAFNHYAEPIFVNTETGEIDAGHAPSFRKNPVPSKMVLDWMEGNYAFVHPDFPQLLFFAVDKIESPEVLACCDPLLLFTCTLCSYENTVSPEGLARHEFIHSLQLRLNPYVSHYLAENIAEDLELMDIAKLVSLIG